MEIPFVLSQEEVEESRALRAAFKAAVDEYKKLTEENLAFRLGIYGFSPEQLMESWNICRATLRRWEKKNELVPVKIGHCTIYLYKDICAFIERHKQTTIGSSKADFQAALPKKFHTR